MQALRDPTQGGLFWQSHAAYYQTSMRVISLSKGGAAANDASASLAVLALRNVGFLTLAMQAVTSAC